MGTETKFMYSYLIEVAVKGKILVEVRGEIEERRAIALSEEVAFYNPNFLDLEVTGTTIKKKETSPNLRIQNESKEVM